MDNTLNYPEVERLSVAIDDEAKRLLPGVPVSGVTHIIHNYSVAKKGNFDCAQLV
jgi:hypothetical protein